MHSTLPYGLSIGPRTIIGWRQARRHERPGRYPIFAIAGGAPEGDGATGDSTSGTSGDTATGTAATGATTGDTGQQAATAATVADAFANWDGKIESLPEAAQKIIRDARKDAGDNRVAKTALEKQQAELLKSIGASLGLKTGDDKPDPVKLAEQLTATQTQAKQAQIELAVYRAASANEGDPIALLDSRTFLAKVADLDPTAKDFDAKVGAAIKAAVTENTKLKAARAAGASSVDHTGGSGEGRTSKKPLPMAEAVAATLGAST